MFDRDTIETAKGPLVIIPIHHATVVFEWDSKMIYCDPVGRADRYKLLDAPNLIVLTHHHQDHMDVETIDSLVGEDTRLVAPKICYDQLPSDIADKTQLMANGDRFDVGGIEILATPMYNRTPERQKFHEKGVGNGYLFDFAGTRVYLASDTEPLEEMDDLAPVDVAFFPMNLPYTMTPDQVVTCIEKTRPKIVYPFHYRFPFDEIGTEPQALIDLMAGRDGPEIRARNWYGDV
ncbi:MBL fold metallo-hydrolase [Pelagibacterium lentulum]|uniref:Metal-dependent hydrolase n=1 Tax=Pelagibacterium lentulum TaxID=2029865 RepID=A0A916R5M5_9HYPH|nr:MBL fold metallo-hydrolase [Pelagibacterium lentulum]GGA35492.1 metal-dependent hydrolase [Pelagibacterium lentulum]